MKTWTSILGWMTHKLLSKRMNEVRLLLMTFISHWTENLSENVSNKRFTRLVMQIELLILDIQDLKKWNAIRICRSIFAVHGTCACASAAAESE